MYTEKTHDEFTTVKDVVNELQGELCKLKDIKKIEIEGKSIGKTIIEIDGVKTLWSGTLKLINCNIIAIITYIRFEKYCDESDKVFVSLINDKFELLNQCNSEERADMIIDFNIGINIGICDTCVNNNNHNYYCNNDYKAGYLYGHKECISFMQNENNYEVYKKLNNKTI
jgi:hypothetical protein